MILIHPPVAKPCEPPAGIAKLCGVLNQHRVKYRVLDANLEGLLSSAEDSTCVIGYMDSPGSPPSFQTPRLVKLLGHLPG